MLLAVIIRFDVPLEGTDTHSALMYYHCIVVMSNVLHLHIQHSWRWAGVDNRLFTKTSTLQWVITVGSLKTAVCCYRWLILWLKALDDGTETELLSIIKTMSRFTHQGPLSLWILIIWPHFADHRECFVYCKSHKFTNVQICKCLSPQLIEVDALRSSDYWWQSNRLWVIPFNGSRRCEVWNDT